MRAILLPWVLLAVVAASGCASAPAGSTTTSSAIARAPDGERIRRLEAFQSRNADWTVHLDDRARLVVTTRWSSLRRDDIRPEVEPFFAANARDLGLDDPRMKRVVSEPTHVRYEQRGRDGKRAVDARLDGGAIVVIAD